MKKIYLIRHGRQDDARCNVNVPLSEAGHKQAILLGQRMINYGIDKLYSSHLIRAVETAREMNQYLNVPYEEVDGIEEIDFGDMTGRTAEDVKAHFTEFAMERNTWETEHILC